MPKDSEPIFSEWEYIYLYICILVLAVFAIFIIGSGYFILFRICKMKNATPQIDNQMVIDSIQ